MHIGRTKKQLVIRAALLLAERVPDLRRILEARQKLLGIPRTV
jgi:hypothetical protein